jgi:hypothetical protein
MRVEDPNIACLEALSRTHSGKSDIGPLNDADFNKDKITSSVMHLLRRYHILTFPVPGMPEVLPIIIQKYVIDLKIRW